MRPRLKALDGLLVPWGAQRLLDPLGRGVEAKLTLVSAPAGFGKTTLLAEWLGGDPDG